MLKRLNPSLCFAATALACAAAFAPLCAQAAGYYAVLPLAGVDVTQSSRPVKITLASATPPAAYVGVPYSFDLGALVSLDGPEGTDPVSVTWSVFSGTLPAGLVLAGNAIFGTPTEASAPIAVKIRAEYASGYQSVGVMQGYAFEVQTPVTMTLAGATPPPAYVGVPYSFDLGALLSLNGPAGTDLAGVTWSVSSGALPAGLTVQGSRISGTPSALSSAQAVTVRAEFASPGRSAIALQNYTFQVPAAKLKQFAGYRAWEDGTYAQSCEGYVRPKDANHVYMDAAGDGVYRISPPGSVPFDAYCDQSSDGGGWTRVALEYEGSAVAWTGAQSGASYTLAQAQIPPHFYTGFGRDNLATFVDYAPFQYSTGDLALTAVVSPKTGYSYQIHRNLNEHYSSHDPETAFLGPTPAGWNNTLTFDRVGVKPGLNFAFAPFYPTLEGRGYALGGTALYNSQEAYGWSVWVK